MPLLKNTKPPLHINLSHHPKPQKQLPPKYTAYSSLPPSLFPLSVFVSGGNFLCSWFFFFSSLSFLSSLKMASVPSRKSFSDVKHLFSYTNRLPAMAEVLTAVCASNDAAAAAASPTASSASSSPRHGEATGPRKRNIFEVTKTAHINIKDYLVRMCKYGHCSPTVFACMALYVDRFRKGSGIDLTSRNVHRILLAAFLVGAKLNDDIYYSNKYYASIGGVSLSEINEIEASFLEITQWDMYVSLADYDAVLADLKMSSLAREDVLKHCARKRLNLFGANKIPQVADAVKTEEKRLRTERLEKAKDEDEYVTATSTSCSPASSSSPSLKAALTTSSTSLPIVKKASHNGIALSQQASLISLGAGTTSTASSPSKRHLTAISEGNTAVSSPATPAAVVEATPVVSEPKEKEKEKSQESPTQAQHAAGSVAYAVRAQKRQGGGVNIAQTKGTPVVLQREAKNCAADEKPARRNSVPLAGGMRGGDKQQPFLHQNEAPASADDMGKTPCPP